jgi:hypothetical protein
MAQGISIIDSAALNQVVSNAINIQAATNDFLNTKARAGLDPPPPVIFNTSAIPEDPLRGNIVNTQV